jgi:hypothetical protein
MGCNFLRIGGQTVEYFFVSKYSGKITEYLSRAYDFKEKAADVLCRAIDKKI